SKKERENDTRTEKMEQENDVEDRERNRKTKTKTKPKPGARNGAEKVESNWRPSQGMSVFCWTIRTKKKRKRRRRRRRKGRKTGIPFYKIARNWQLSPIERNTHSRRIRFHRPRS
ncbi:hypothetical protein K0M31_005112, partial [Melipona bicolor]